MGWGTVVETDAETAEPLVAEPEPLRGKSGATANRAPAAARAAFEGRSCGRWLKYWPMVPATSTLRLFSGLPPALATYSQPTRLAAAAAIATPSLAGGENSASRGLPASAMTGTNSKARTNITVRNRMV